MRYPYYQACTDEWNNGDRSIENPTGSMFETQSLEKAKRWCRKAMDDSKCENVQATIVLIESRLDSHFVWGSSYQ